MWANSEQGVDSVSEELVSASALWVEFVDAVKHPHGESLETFSGLVEVLITSNVQVLEWIINEGRFIVILCQGRNHCNVPEVNSVHNEKKTQKTFYTFYNIFYTAQY